ncbi:MAG: universal stress protein [Deltaproteobacteria bacterium]|nr:universal stress protein [Deltaproteobacteria bacterium]
MRVFPKHILCATDFSDFSNHAIPYGIALAKEFKAKLFLCHVIDLSSAAIYGEAVLALEEQQKRMIKYARDEMTKLMRKESIDWEPMITVGNAAHEIARLAADKKIDITISASHGRAGLKRLILGSVTERLIRTLPCPLLVVRSPDRGFVAPADQAITLKRILVGCDFSPISSLAFQYGLSLAQEFQADLHLIHVIQPPLYDYLKKPSEPKQDLQKDLGTEIKSRLSDMVPDDARTWCKPVTVLLAGQPHEEITKYAMVNDIDLIVLGVRGHGLVETLFVGSTTDRVMRRAACPVLSVQGASNL